MKLRSILLTLFFILGIVVGGFFYFKAKPLSREKTQEIISHCLSLTTNTAYVSCIRNSFRPYTNIHTLSTVLSQIEESTYTMSTNAAIDNQRLCHGAGHIIGQDIVTRTHAPVAAIIGQCGVSCGYGCIHGAMYSFSKVKPDIISSLDSLCQSSTTYPMSYTDQDNCTHGIGHFLTEYTSYDVQKAIIHCQTGLTSFNQECISGAIMEMFSEESGNGPPHPFPKDILAYCQTYPTFAFDQCIRELVAMKPFSSLSEGFGSCKEFPIELQHACAVSVGTKVWYEKEGNVENIVHECASQSHFLAECIEGAVRTSINMRPGSNNAQEICDKGPQETQNICSKFSHVIESNKSIRN